MHIMSTIVTSSNSDSLTTVYNALKLCRYRSPPKILAHSKYSETSDKGHSEKCLQRTI